MRAAARIAGRGLWLTEILSFLPPLLTRLIIGIAFFQTGSGKWRNFDRTVSYFSDLGIPFARANAAFISTLELVGGICLILGLGTRIFAFLLSCSMLVALLTADKENFIKNFPGGLTDVVPVVYGMFLLWLLLFGPGPVSIDCWIRKKMGLVPESDNSVKVAYGK